MLIHVKLQLTVARVLAKTFYIAYLTSWQISIFDYIYKKKTIETENLYNVKNNRIL